MGPVLSLLQILILVFLGAAAATAVANIYTLRRLGTYPLPARWPCVSVMVPARNEEQNIGPCVSSLLTQDYPDFEVLVLDDNSEDRTGEILSVLATHSPRLRILHGRPLPEGWLGKHWAGHQLAGEATGELLLFTDADTRHAPTSLSDSVAALIAEDADLLSVLPFEEVGTWAEKLVVPTMVWGILAFLPLALAYRLKTPLLVSAVGQYMLFKRSAFDRIGGFEAVRTQILDDRAQAQRIKALGMRWRLASGLSSVRCRMYRNTKQVFAGFGKNYFANLGGSIALFLLTWTWLAIAYLLPIGVFLAGLLGAGVPETSMLWAVATILLSLFLWASSHRRFGFPPYLTLLYPVTILLTYAIAIYSVVLALTGRSSWKGRTIAEPLVK